MTLNGIMAVIFRYFNEFDSLQGALRKSGWRYSWTLCNRNVAQSSWFLAIYHLRRHGVGNCSIRGIKRKRGSKI